MAKTTVTELIKQLYEKIEYLSLNPSGDAIEEHRQIDALLCELIEAEKVSTSTSIDLPNRQEKWPQFVRWCSDQGVPMDQIEVKKVSADGECGLFALQPFTRNDEVLRVPRKMFLSRETVPNNPSLKNFLIKDPLISQMPNLELTILLLSEYLKGESSFWWPYLSTLPRSYSTVLYLSHEELLQLSGSPLLEEVVKIKRSVARQYAYLAMKVERAAQVRTTKRGDRGNHKKNTITTITTNGISSFLSPLTYELFRWAVSTVMTRQNLVPSEADPTKTNTLALIPLWDMCNHRQGNFCTDFDPSSATLVFYSMADLQAGDEIFNYYGDRTNGDFFLNNGFVYADHKEDAVRIKLGFSSGDILYPLKDALANNINLLTTENGAQFKLAHRSSPLNPQLLAFVRIFHLDKDQLEHWLTLNEKEVFYDAQCEQLQFLDDKVATFLKIRCTLLLRKYPAIPAGAFLNPNVEKIIACEKAILSSYT